MESPCIRNCCLDSDEICLGCFRSIKEIIQWASSDTTIKQKQQILSNAEHRKPSRQNP
ncbi:MAG: DUF1289 domain-containing protein [Methylophagaceae bacterium]